MCALFNLFSYPFIQAALYVFGEKAFHKIIEDKGALIIAMHQQNQHMVNLSFPYNADAM